MARRSWRVGPDQLIETRRGQIAVVSRQAQIEAIADAVTCADRLGGTIAVLYGRQATGIEGEMATTELIVNWQDRTDAKPQYEEPIAFEPQEPVELIDGGQAVTEPVSNGGPVIDDPPADDEPVDDDVKARALQEA